MRKRGRDIIPCCCKHPDNWGRRR